MIKYLTKQFGMTALGLCILISTIYGVKAIHGFTIALSRNTQVADSMNVCKTATTKFMQTAVNQKGN